MSECCIPCTIMTDRWRYHGWAIEVIYVSVPKAENDGSTAKQTNKWIIKIIKMAAKHRERH